MCVWQKYHVLFSFSSCFGVTLHYSTTFKLWLERFFGIEHLLTMMMNVKPQPQESEILRFRITLLYLWGYGFVMMGKCNFPTKILGHAITPKKLAMTFLYACCSTWVTWWPCHVATSLYLGPSCIHGQVGPIYRIGLFNSTGLLVM